MSKLNNHTGFPPLLPVILSIVIGVVAYLSFFKYFTIDEFQLAHSTWLTSQGKVPYLDFFEHHLPISYLLSSHLIFQGLSFVQQALLLRSFVLFLILLTIGMVVLPEPKSSTIRSSRLVSGILIFSFGFTTLSMVEYRVDSLSSLLLFNSLLLLDRNRNKPSPHQLVAAGSLFALACSITQKTILIGGVVVSILYLCDRVGNTRTVERLFPRLSPFLLGVLATTLFLGCIVVAHVPLSGLRDALLGVVSHEKTYLNVSILSTLLPYLSTAPLAAIVIALGAVCALRFNLNRFWGIVFATSTVINLAIRGQFPYNFFIPVAALAICAGDGLTELTTRHNLPRALARAISLLLLLVVVEQSRFMFRGPTNREQFDTLTKVEPAISPTDRFIDSSGGLMFMPSASHYFYFGEAQLKTFGNALTDQLNRDYRNPDVLFWIADHRSLRLPSELRRYLGDNFIPYYGSVMVRGFSVTADSETASSLKIQVDRPAQYWLYRVDKDGDRTPLENELEIIGLGLKLDGVLVNSSPVPLPSGPHQFETNQGGGPLVLTPVPPYSFPRTHKLRTPYTIPAVYYYELSRALSYPNIEKSE